MNSWIERDGPWIPHERKLKRSITVKPQETNQEQEDKSVQYGVIYYPLRCPKCKSKNIKTHTSEPPIRYHKCRDCGYNFRSREAEEEKNK